MENHSILTNVNINLIQYYSIAFSIFFLLFIIELVRRKKIREEYSIIWIIIGFVFLFFSIFRNALNILASNLGIAYVPMALLLILIVGVFLILVQFSTVISKLTEQNKKIIQDNALLQFEIDELKKEFDKSKTTKVNKWIVIWKSMVTKSVLRYTIINAVRRIFFMEL